MVGEEVPAGMPRWCLALGVVPVLVGGLALLGSGGDDVALVAVWAAGAAWVTRALAAWVLRRQGVARVVADLWVARELDRPWLVVPIAAFAVWALVASVRTALSPTGDWWSWVLVVLASALLAVGVLVAYDTSLQWWRRRRRGAS